MSLPERVPAVTASIAVIALLAALPASAQTANSSQIASNKAGPQSMAATMVPMGANAAPTQRPSTSTQTAGSANGSGQMARVANELK